MCVVNRDFASPESSKNSVQRNNTYSFYLHSKNSSLKKVITF